MNDKLLSILGFVQKSGNLVSGEQSCIVAIKKKLIKLVIVTEDASDNTKQKFAKLCKKNSIPYYIVGMSEDFSFAIGKQSRTIYAVKDRGFANKIIQILDATRM